MVGMTRIVCTHVDPFIDAGLLDELYRWFDANQILHVRLDGSEPISIIDGPDGRLLQYAVTVSADGPVVTEVRTSPLVVEPPAHWPAAE